MQASATLYTHPKAETKIHAYCNDVRDLAALHGLEIEVIDLDEDPLQAIKHKVSSVPTLVISEPSTIPVVRVGTAQYEHIDSLMMSLY